MFRKLLIGSLAILALSISAAAQTADDIIAKNIKATGGMDKLKAAKTIRMTGKLSLSQGLEAPVVLEQKRPNSVRMEFTIQGMTGVQAYDGKIGWSLMPFSGMN